MPLAAFATLQGDMLSIRAAWGDPQGISPLVIENAQDQVCDESSAVALGERVAKALRSRVPFADES